MFGGGEDLVQIDRHAKGDEKEAPDARADPVWGLEGGRGNELGPQGGGALGEKDGIIFRGERRRGWDLIVACRCGKQGVEVWFCDVRNVIGL